MKRPIKTGAAIRQFFLSRNISKSAKILAILAILYVVFPLDMVPDYIPVFGWIEDIVIAILTLNFMRAKAGEAGVSTPAQGEIIDVTAKVVEEE